MTISNDFKKLSSVAVWTIAIIAYLVVFVSLAVSISSFLWDLKIGNDFITNNQLFFGQLIGYWLTALILLLLAPKKYRDLGYKLLLVAVIILTAYYELPSIVMWHIDIGLWYNFLWSVLAIAGVFVHLSIYLLSFSAIERLFKVDLKKPILTNKKVLITLVTIAIVAILITLSFFLVGLQQEWTI